MTGNVEIFTPASHHDVLALVTQLAVLLMTARLLGEVALRFRQPSVIGEILAGIILGPSLLGSIFPAIHGVIIPKTPVQGYLLEAISLMGAMFLLLITGLETDLKLIKKHAKTALGVSAGGICVTFISGFFLGQWLPDELLADSDKRLVFSLFLATAMSISAIPVIAKVLIDLKMTRRDIGQTILAAGMSDDTVGWILLSIVAGIAVGDATVGLASFLPIVKVLLFLGFSFTLGRWFVKKVIDFVQDNVLSRDRLLSFVVVLMFLWGALTQWLHIEPVLGAFVMGILIGGLPRIPSEVHEKLESIALAVFAPIFFAVAGLKVNIQDLFDPQLFKIALIVIAIATFGKVVGTFLGATIIGKRDRWTALSFGAALNARGAMEIIVATIGLSLGILSQEMFSIIVVMAMVTSLMAPSALRWVLKRVKEDPQETKRLQEEALVDESLVENIHRILLPVRRWKDDDQSKMIQIVKSRLLQNMGRSRDLSITLLTAEQDEDEEKLKVFHKFLSVLFKNQELLKKVTKTDDVVKTILNEAEKEYDLLVLGTAKTAEKRKALFSSVTDELVRNSPCLTMITHAKSVDVDWVPRKILVPINGSNAAKNAAELAFLISVNSNEEIIFLSVIEDQQNGFKSFQQKKVFKTQKRISKEMIEEMKKMADLKGKRCWGKVEVGPSVQEVITDVAEKENVDLVVIGSELHPGTDRLFLGRTVEYILSNTHSPVIILNSH